MKNLPTGEARLKFHPKELPAKFPSGEGRLKGGAGLTGRPFNKTTIMYTCNITFAVSKESLPHLLRYIRMDLIPAIFNEESPAREPSLKKVIETGGQKSDDQHAVSIALAAILPTEETAHLWNDQFLLPALGSFHEKFGAEALFFVTLLENLTI